MSEFLISKEFSRYQVKLIGLMNSHIIGLLNQNKFDQIKGALDLAYKIIKLPLETNNSENMQLKIQENIKRFQSNFIRMGAEDE